MKKLDRKTTISRINRELPIIIVYNHLVLHPNLIHKNAIKNTNILNGDLELQPIDLEDVDFEKDKTVKVPCLFHDTLNDDSTNFVLPKKPESSGLTGNDKKDFGNYYNCFACQHSKKPLGVIDFYIVMRFGIPPKLLTVFKDMDKEVKKAFWKGVEELSALMGISYDDSTREISDEERMQMRIQAIYNLSATIYHQYLKSGSKFAKSSLAYLFKERGFTHLGNHFYSVIDELKIGCAPKPEGDFKVDSFTSTFLYTHLKKEGFTDEELLASKVVRYSDQHKRIVDKHKNGIILPYTNEGKVYNLYCRQFTKDKKWRHMKLGIDIEFPMGFDIAKKYPVIIPVEGEMDFITMRALGFKNVVLTGGTNGFKDSFIHRFSLQYIKSEGKYCRTICLALDGDDKGQNGLDAIGQRLLLEDIDVRAMRLQFIDPKTGKLFTGDPNEFLVHFQSEAKTILNQLFEEALSFHAFQLLRLADKEKPTNPTEQLGFLRRNRTALNHIEPDEKLFIALEMANHFSINPDWLLSVWGMMPSKAPSAAEATLPEGALDRHWLVLFDKKEMADACGKRLKNVVYYDRPDTFVSAAKNHPNLRAIALYEGMSAEFKDTVYHAFPNLKYQTFQKTDIRTVETAKKEDFMRFFQPATNPYVN